MQFHIIIESHDRGIIVDASKNIAADADVACGLLWKELLKQGFCRKPALVVEENPPATSWTSIDAKNLGLRQDQIILGKRRYTLVQVPFFSEEILEEIASESSFLLACIWILPLIKNEGAIVEEIHTLRMENPTFAEKWFECESEFFLCDGDGSYLVWNRSKLTENEIHDAASKICKNLDWDFKCEIIDKSKHPR